MGLFSQAGDTNPTIDWLIPGVYSIVLRGVRNPAIKKLCFAAELCSAATGMPDRHYSCLHFFFYKIIAFRKTSYIIAALYQINHNVSY